MYPAYFDCHCDTLLKVESSGESLIHGECAGRHVTLDAMREYPHYVQFFAMFSDMGRELRRQCGSEAEFVRRVRTEDVQPDQKLFDHYEKLIALFYKQMELCADWIIPCRSTADIDAARKQGKMAAVLTVEGAEQLDGSSVEDAYARGVRACTLTWNYRNRVGGSNVSGGGITSYGEEFLKRCEITGMLVDISHSSEALFYDVARLSKVPFIASHSNARSIGPHRRNLTDEQFLALCRAGGVAGFNMYSAFILDRSPVTLEDCADHIGHFLALGGAKHIAIGGDLDGCESIPEGIGGSGDVGRLADVLARRQVPVSVIEDIFYNNIHRVCEEVWK